MSKNFLSDFSHEEQQLSENDEEDITLNDGDVVEETIAYQRTMLKKANEEIEGLKQDREQRKSFSTWIFIFTCVYMAVTIAIVCLCAFSVMRLSDTILVTLLTTTLTEVLGMFTFVAKYLFHHK